jgi:3-deoxy-manno-octulosonate cytidylyltransferase (CMP-KDO synthetase)
MTPCVALIPARFGSTRLPGKPLLKKTGKYLIQHVYERVASARKVDRIIVATDDERIVTAVESFGGEVRLTDRGHPSGTDRVAEVARELSEEIILNVQGDEPDLAPDLLDRMVELLHRNKKVDMATAAVPIRDRESFLSPHVVKVVVGAENQALYFSRASIPHGAEANQELLPLKHIGIYAFRREILLRFTGLPPVELEKTEKLEQLRALHHGMAMTVLLTEEDHLGIDTHEEYEAFVKRVKGNTSAGHGEPKDPR